MKNFILWTCVLFCCGCGGRNENLKPITGFDSSRYLGNRHEVARLENSFEKGLEKVTAAYSMNGNGEILVINTGFDSESKKWKTATGHAKFAKTPDIGELKVSFFRPFYGAYVILEIDRQNYNYALVSGGNLKYLWILSRTPALDSATTELLLKKARSFGFNTDKLIFSKQ